MDNIVVKITAESDMSDAQKDLEVFKQKESEILTAMEAVRKKQLEFINDTKQLKTANAEYKKLEKDLKTTQTTMAGFATQQKKVNDSVVAGATSSKSLRTQIASIREELSRMEMAGDSSSKSYINLSVQAGKLQDQMGDTRQTIQHLSSDTRGLDTAMGIGRGLAGGFTAATSAAALLGGESEALTKAFLKVQAVMSILNGVQEVANMLNKNSAVMDNLKTAAENSSTLAKIKNVGSTISQNVVTTVQTGLESKNVVVKGLSTAAQWALNTAVLAFPIVALVAGLTAIVAGFTLFANGAAKAKKEQEQLNNESMNFSEDMKIRNRNIERTLELMNAQGKSTAELKKYEIDRATENKKYYQQQYNYILSNKRAEKEQVEEARKNMTDSSDNLSNVYHKYKVAEITEDKKAVDDKKALNEKALQDKKALNEKALQDRKDKLAKELEAVKETRKKEKAYLLTMEVEGEALSKKALTNSITNLKKSEKEKDPILQAAADKLTKRVNDNIEKANDQYKNDQQNAENSEQRREQELQAAMQTTTEIGNLLFDYKKQKLDQELSDLEYYYTTDAEAAAKNKDLKLISEDEMAAKKLQIRQQQTKADKEQALFNIAIGTAQNIIAAKLNPILIGLAVALGIAQTAAVLSRPLPKYAKGLKGGKGGHFATVGELGAETMWIPDNAAIIPHNRQMSLDTFKEFNIPMDIDSRLMPGDSIDYDKLGKAVAQNVKIPTPKPVTIHVDKSGVAVDYVGSKTTYLNKKYSGSWN